MRGRPSAPFIPALPPPGGPNRQTPAHPRSWIYRRSASRNSSLLVLPSVLATRSALRRRSGGSDRERILVVRIISSWVILVITHKFTRSPCGGQGSRLGAPRPDFGV